MKKNYSFLLILLVLLSGKILAQTTQPCATDEMYKKYKQRFPQIAEFEKQQNENIINYMKAHPRNVGARTTEGRTDTDIYYIPVVFHVIHNYGSEYIPDNTIYNLIAEMNRFYTLKNDTANIVPEFKKWVGKANIQFYLATVDPNGNPTNGITRRRAYLTYGYDDQAKVDLWPPANYYNIWSEEHVGELVAGGVVLAYANFPSSAAAYPFNDGVICRSDYVNDGTSNGTSANSSTIDHETGHYFNLLHTWNSSGQSCGVACGDDDVDDTPPTKGHFSTCELNDTACAENYYKIYPDINGLDSLVKYPDTTNTQNTMDYSSCVNMFTKGQVVRMHAALNSDIGSRDNLWDSTNLVSTGVGTYSPTNITFTAFPRKDLKPNPAFSVTPLTTAPGITQTNYMGIIDYFTFAGSTGLAFRNESWNDTVTAVNWQFSNTASPATTSNTGNFQVTFNDPGWVDVKMTVTGNGSGDTTADFPRAVFVANPTGTPALGYYQEFSGADTAQWPMFNYYNNSFQWQMANVGYDDHNCVMYTGYDTRINPLLGIYPYTSPPNGDFDDLFSIPLDISGFSGGPCSFNFYYSSASRSSNSYDINDTLEIDYSTNKSTTWNTLAVLGKSSLCNKGAVSTPYTPSSSSDWNLFSINLPAAAQTPYTVFRFRYKPNTAVEIYQDPNTGDYSYIPGPYSSGNNFYMDRITVSPWPAGVGEVKLGNMDVVVVPNPTSGDAYVVVKDMDNTSAKILVTDVTGKAVYTTSQPIIGTEARILIPHSFISIPGMYLVQTITGNQVRTQKLIVQ